MNLNESFHLLAELGYPTPAAPADSPRRFPDGAGWRIEIPSCEGPQVMEAVIEEAARRQVTLHRVSQGSGIMMLTDAEIARMVDLGGSHDIEVCLFLGPRAAWDTGGQAKVTGAVGAAARGSRAVAACLFDAFRAVDLGVRSLLVGDLGVLHLLDRLKEQGRLPSDLVLKTSVLMPLTNAPTAVVYAEAGATSLNVSTDLDIATLAQIREATTVPLDMYVEVPDDQGGSVRFFDVPEVIRVAAPVHLKMGLRNAPNIYPVGAHLEDMAMALGRERVRRAELVLRVLEGEHNEVIR